MTAVVWISGAAVTLWVIVWYAIFVYWAVVCWRKRRIVWFVLGFFLPFCWLIGALLHSRREP